MGISPFGRSFAKKPSRSMGMSAGGDWPYPTVRKLVEVCNDKITKVLASDPNPAKYKIIDETVVGTCVVVRVNYPDCTNYEGKKILVFDDVNQWKKLKKKKRLDPHFVEDQYSPMARFEPTERGMVLAVKTARILSNLCESQTKEGKL
jgi:hypothetical protein